MLPQQSLHHLENVFLRDFAPASALNLDRSLTCLQPHVRTHAQECVAPDLLATLHRFQQKCMRLVLGDRQKCRDWRQQIGADGFHHRDERSVLRQAAELFEIGLQHRLLSGPRRLALFQSQFHAAEAGFLL